ncbi:glycosyltransferase family A protein [Prochlorococcus marinus]|uniref:glycosyltransferase family A protein n=1 Tax=Prochlorococcus TaxID=1218 RepID=UPI0007B3551A|nr:glycosyltransferase family A protein [Prochlorococcus marinus]KZR77518.1 hypothetical protein PMIT1323_00893 [Prochlorococcus marinus str. MIT 1323]
MELSIIVGSYELTHQISNTVTSILSALSQTVVSAEIIIADNSKSLKTIDSNIVNYINVNVIDFSELDIPIHASMNLAVERACGDYLCLMIDGARLWSPNIIREVDQYLSLYTVVHVPNYQLGTDYQMYGNHGAGSFKCEDKLLIDCGWPFLKTSQLIELSFLEPHAGIGPTIFESNCLFLSRKMWDEVNGYDLQFQRKDGGFASADLLSRLIENNCELKVLADAGTFHQFHFGTTTSSPLQTRKALKEMTLEYFKIRAKPPKRHRVSFH